MIQPQSETVSPVADPSVGSGLTPAQCRAVVVALRERGRIDAEPADDGGWTPNRANEAR